MPAIRHRKKKDPNDNKPDDRRKIVSAYSEEGAHRNVASRKRENRFRVITLIIVIVLLLGTIAATWAILHFTSVNQ